MQQINPYEVLTSVIDAPQPVFIKVNSRKKQSQYVGTMPSATEQTEIYVLRSALPPELMRQVDTLIATLLNQ